MSAATISDADARASLLGAADALFYRRGIADVRMAEIRDLAGVSMRRIYSIAPSKSDLVTLWLQHRHETWMTDFAERIDTARKAGASPVAAVFTALERWMIATSFRGCGFINTNAEAGELTDDHRAVIRHHKRALGSYLAALTGADDQTGDAFALVVDGAIVHAAIFATTDPIHAAHRVALALTESTSP